MDGVQELGPIGPSVGRIEGPDAKADARHAREGGAEVREHRHLVPPADDQIGAQHLEVAHELVDLHQLV